MGGSESMHIGGSEPMHWFIIIILLVLVAVPFARILQRTGHSMWWVIAFVIPGITLIALWVLAFARWPAVDRQ